jgi:hypothetical protein
MSTLKQVCIRLMSFVLVMLATHVVLQAQILDRQVGEVFVAIGNGQYQVWHPTPPTAALVETITQNFNNVTYSGGTAGCAFDPTYHPFTTNLTVNDVFRHAIDDPQNGIEQINVATNAAGGGQPTSVAFDSSGNSYVGNAGGNGLIQEYSPNGNLLKTLPVNTTKLKGGSAWIDLSSDSSTIYLTNGSNTISQFSVASSRVSKFASISGAVLYALRVLPHPTTNGGVLLVAAVFTGTSNIQLLNARGATVQTYTIPNENNLQVLTLDPNGTSFWAGNPTTNNFFRLNLASGAIEVNANTGVASGPTGVCAYGGFSAALYQPITVGATFTSASTPGCAVNTQNNSLADCTFSTPIPDLVNGPNSFAITLNGIDFSTAPNGLQLTYNYSQIAQAAGTSDSPLSWPCDLTSPDGTKCEINSVDVSALNGGTPTYQGYDTSMFTFQTTLNPQVLKNESHLVTDFVIHGSTKTGGSGSIKSVFTINEQPIQVTGSQSCGYISPLLNSQYNQGRTIPFKFTAVSPPNTCPSGPNFITTLNARLMLVQLNNLSNPNAPPHNVAYTLANGTSCPTTGCYYRLDLASGTWLLNVDTSSLQGAVNGVPTQYLGTTFDDSGQIPSFSTTTGGQSDIFSIN